jgi:hypothetical protein
MKLILTTSFQHLIDGNTILLSSDSDLAHTTKLFAAASFDLIES